MVKASLPPVYAGRQLADGRWRRPVPAATLRHPGQEHIGRKAKQAALFELESIDLIRASN